MRKVSDPGGTRWRVDVEWTGIRFGSEVRARMRRRRERPRPATADEKFDLLGHLFDAATFAGDSSLGGLVAGVVIGLFVVIAVLLFPWLLVILLDIAVVLVFPLVAIAVIVWRVARHRPFTVIADRDHARIATWQVVGIKEARRIERRVADAVVAGGDPTHLFPEYAARR